MMNLVDSSGWIEYFTGSSQAKIFKKPVEDSRHLIVPTVCLYEVFKKLIQTFDEKKALEAIAVMHQGRVIAFDEEIALMSAKFSHELKLPMADSIIVATARQYDAVIWTQDSDFKSLPDAKYIQKIK